MNRFSKLFFPLKAVIQGFVLICLLLFTFMFVLIVLFTFFSMVRAIFSTMSIVESCFVNVCFVFACTLSIPFLTVLMSFDNSVSTLSILSTTLRTSSVYAIPKRDCNTPPVSWIIASGVSSDCRFFRFGDWLVFFSSSAELPANAKKGS